MAYVRIPKILQPYTHDKDIVHITSCSGKDFFTELFTLYPSLKNYLIDATQQMSHFVNIYLNSHDIRSLSFAEYALTDHDVITIVPAFAGG